jgi:hypothetical protein
MSAGRGQAAASTSGPTDYFVDLLFRPDSPAATASDTVGTASAGAQPALSSEARAKITRILAPAGCKTRSLRENVAV